jgi:catechol 2,3-dioxygenase
MPSRGDLASWVRDAATNQFPIIGASDHAVSEAIYLSDPEGNGVELYADRPSAEWRSLNGVTSMPSDPLDVDDLVRADPLRVWSGAPDALVVGHMHLQVGAIPAAEAFYGQILGFDVTCRYPGGSFFGAGGYHHQLATNIWNSRNAGPINEAAAGLAGFEISVHGAEGLSLIRQRSVTAGLRIEYMDDGFTLHDPWGLPIALRAK